MFFSIPFPDLFVVAHSQWDDRNTRCKLRILTERETAEMLLGELPQDEADSLGKHVHGVFKYGSAESSVEIAGDVAFSPCERA